MLDSQVEPVCGRRQHTKASTNKMRDLVNLSLSKTYQKMHFQFYMPIFSVPVCVSELEIAKYCTVKPFVSCQTLNIVLFRIMHCTFVILSDTRLVAEFN